MNFARQQSNANNLAKTAPSANDRRQSTESVARNEEQTDPDHSFGGTDKTPCSDAQRKQREGGSKKPVLVSLAVDRAARLAASRAEEAAHASRARALLAGSVGAKLLALCYAADQQAVVRDWEKAEKQFDADRRMLASAAPQRWWALADYTEELATAIESAVGGEQLDLRLLDRNLLQESLLRGSRAVPLSEEAHKLSQMLRGALVLGSMLWHRQKRRAKRTFHSLWLPSWSITGSTLDALSSLASEARNLAFEERRTARRAASGVTAPLCVAFFDALGVLGVAPRSSAHLDAAAADLYRASLQLSRFVLNASPGCTAEQSWLCGFLSTTAPSEDSLTLDLNKASIGDKVALKGNRESGQAVEFGDLFHWMLMRRHFLRTQSTTAASQPPAVPANDLLQLEAVRLQAQRIVAQITVSNTAASYVKLPARLTKAVYNVQKTLNAALRITINSVSPACASNPPSTTQTCTTLVRKDPVTHFFMPI